MKNITIITHSDKGEQCAQRLVATGFEAQIYRSPKQLSELWQRSEALIFIGALGICVREIAPLLQDKKTDPAVINLDVQGQYVQSVLSGHIGGANALSEDIARRLGAIPIVTTVSDTSGLWPLDVLPQRYGWEMECDIELTKLMAAFVNRQKTALLLEVRDKGTLHLENALPEHVEVFYTSSDFKAEDYAVVLAVTPFIHPFGKNVIYYRPKVLHLGIGCQRDLVFDAFGDDLQTLLSAKGLSSKAVASIATVDIKAEEAALLALSQKWNVPLQVYAGEELARYETPNPSAKVNEVTGSYSVAEAAAMHASSNVLLLEKQKGKSGDKHFTCAVGFDHRYERKGFVEFVGAGPGDPELVSVKGKRFLQTADLILYAGSLVPKELTQYAKPGCTVVSSAGMDLKTQIETMRPFYERGLFVVRLHTGDPCIYGAIQEQMAVMDNDGWNYHITPGISSFQAAAAALESQFTIPEEVQTIILTRGEGRTPMPEREQLSKLARSQSTMCIYLSASIADKVQQDLLEHYPPETPVAVCYKLTWKEEKVYRSTLEKLAQTVKENKLTMTTMIVVGKAIDNRSGFSKLYDKQFTHAFRKGK